MEGVHLGLEGITNTVYDSSLISDGIMSHNLYNRGEFPEILYKDYLRLNNIMQRNVAGHPFMGPDLIIYLEAPFEQMLSNIAKRGREMETTDPKLTEYYKSVWNIYRDWYNSYGNTPVLKLDLDILLNNLLAIILSFLLDSLIAHVVKGLFLWLLLIVIKFCYLVSKIIIVILIYFFISINIMKVIIS